MLKRMNLLVVVGLVGVLSAGTAMAIPMPFALGFDGSDLPDAAGNSFVDSGYAGRIVSSSDGDIYSDGYSNSGNAARWIEDGTVWQPQNKETTIEYRLDIVSAVNLQLAQTTGINGAQWYIELNNGAVNDTLFFKGGGGGTVNVSQGFHKIRVTYEFASGAWARMAKVYIDDNPTPVLPAWWGYGNTGAPWMEFGDRGAFGQSGQIDIDYISWTHDGLFPAPEPATLAVLGFGGLSLLIRRRRRSVK